MAAGDCKESKEDRKPDRFGDLVGVKWIKENSALGSSGLPGQTFEMSARYQRGTLPNLVGARLRLGFGLKEFKISRC